MSEIKSTDYLHIEGWMINELDLKGNELMAFALIHGFSKDGINEYIGSQGYIMKWLNCSEKTVRNTMAALREKELIIPRLWKDARGEKRVAYRVNPEKIAHICAEGPVKFTGPGSVKITGRVGKFLPDGPVKFTDNNINNNINNNTPYSPPEGDGSAQGKKKRKRGELTEAQAGRFDIFWDVYPVKKDKQRAKEAWQKIDPDDEMTSMMVKAVFQQTMSDEWQRGYIPRPTTWLNGKRWEDEMSERDMAPRTTAAAAQERPVSQRW